MNRLSLVFLSLAACSDGDAAHPPAAGTAAPRFTAPLHTGRPFDLAGRQGKWTVLYFYPKDFTPGCTKQACAFRDAIKAITDKGADVYGISRDSVAQHQAFVAEHQLSFALIADEDGRVAKAYGVLGRFGNARRWTFIIGPDLLIRDVRQDVDPAIDAQQVAAKLSDLQK